MWILDFALLVGTDFAWIPDSAIGHPVDSTWIPDSALQVKVDSMWIPDSAKPPRNPCLGQMWPGFSGHSFEPKLWPKNSGHSFESKPVARRPIYISEFADDIYCGRLATGLLSKLWPKFFGHSFDANL